MEKETAECDQSDSHTTEVKGKQILAQQIFREFSKNASFVWRRTSKSIAQIDFNKYMDNLSRRPWLAAVIVLGTFMTIVVVTTFIFIMATTIAVAITGIILIEGTIVTVGTIIFCGCLLSLWILIGMFVVTGCCFYYGTYYFHTNLYSAMGNMQKIKSIFQGAGDGVPPQEGESSKKID